MLFKKLDKLKRDAIMMAIILMLAGVFLIIIPESYINYTGGFIGFFLLVISAAAVFDFIGSKKALIHYIELAAGLFIGLFGAALFIFESLFIDMLSFFSGIIPTALGVAGIAQALILARRSKRRGWWILIILSSLLLIFGILVFINPLLVTPKAIMEIIGATLIYSAAISLLRLIWIWPIHKN